MPITDKILMLRSTGDLTASLSTSPVTIHGTPVKGMAMYVTVPASAGTTNTLFPKVWASHDNATYRLISVHPGGAVQIAAAGTKEFVVPFALPTVYKYVKGELVIAGSTGTPNYGVVKAWITLGYGGDWYRGKNFEA